MPIRQGIWIKLKGRTWRRSVISRRSHQRRATRPGRGSRPLQLQSRILPQLLTQRVRTGATRVETCSLCAVHRWTASDRLRPSWPFRAGEPDARDERPARTKTTAAVSVSRNGATADAVKLVWEVIETGRRLIARAPDARKTFSATSNARPLPPSTARSGRLSMAISRAVWRQNIYQRSIRRTSPSRLSPKWCFTTAVMCRAMTV